MSPKGTRTIPVSDEKFMIFSKNRVLYFLFSPLRGFNAFELSMSLKIDSPCQCRISIVRGLRIDRYYIISRVIIRC